MSGNLWDWALIGTYNDFKIEKGVKYEKGKQQGRNVPYGKAEHQVGADPIQANGETFLEQERLEDEGSGVAPARKHRLFHRGVI